VRSGRTRTLPPFWTFSCGACPRWQPARNGMFWRGGVLALILARDIRAADDRQVALGKRRLAEGPAYHRTATRSAPSSRRTGAARSPAGCPRRSLSPITWASGRSPQLGTSTGGAYALALAALAPERVLGVVACCSMTDMRGPQGRATMSGPHVRAVWEAPDRAAALAAATDAHGEDGTKMHGDIAAVLAPSDLALSVARPWADGSADTGRAAWPGRYPQLRRRIQPACHAPAFCRVW